MQKMKKLPIQKAFTLLESGPVVLVTTADGCKQNIMTLSWTMVMDFTPPLCLFNRVMELFLPSPEKNGRVRNRCSRC